MLPSTPRDTISRSMLGGNDTNPLLPVSMDNVRLPYNANAAPSVPLDVPIGGDADMLNMVGGKNASLANLPMKAPSFSQHKLPLSLHDSTCLDGAGQTRNMLKQIPVSTGLRLSYGEEEHYPSISSAGESTVANLSSMLAHSDDLQRELVRQNDELDQYIRVQEETIRKGIMELKHRHTVSLLTAFGKEVSSKLHEKDIEIHSLIRRNNLLTEKINQTVVEAQNWHYTAQQNASLVKILRLSISQRIKDGAACLKEGCGENMVDEGISSCNPNPLNPMANLEHVPSMKQPMICKACNGKEVSVLLLPCRHLCLCIECDASIDSCPVCREKKTGSLQVYMS